MIGYTGDWPEANNDFPTFIFAHKDRIPVAAGEITGRWVDHGPGEPDEMPYVRLDYVEKLTRKRPRSRTLTTWLWSVAVFISVGIGFCWGYW